MDYGNDVPLFIFIISSFYYIHSRWLRGIFRLFSAAFPLPSSPHLSPPAPPRHQPASFPLHGRLDPIASLLQTISPASLNHSKFPLLITFTQ